MKSKSGITALITGASAGIGLELAKLHASQGGKLVLVARRKDRLESIKANLEEKYKVKVTIISKDLSKRESPKEIYAELKKQKITVDYLINNAGFSQQGYFQEIDWDIQESMIMVNVMSLSTL